MKKTADAVIIGGGAVGTSTLYHLTKLGMTDVVLLDKGSLASGSTGDSAAIVRQHYSNEVSIRLVKRSIEIMRSFPDEMGVDVFTQSGWCFLIPLRPRPHSSKTWRSCNDSASVRGRYRCRRPLSSTSRA